MPCRNWHSFESHFYGAEDASVSSQWAVFNGKTHHDRCFSHTNQPELPNLKYLKLREYVLEEGQILLINFYLSLGRFSLSHTHTHLPFFKKNKGNKVSVNLRNLMFTLISNKPLNRETHRGVLYQYIELHPYKISADVVIHWYSLFL